MLLLWTLIAEDPSVELYYPAVVLLLLVPAVLGYFFSLRVTAAYYIAVIAALVVGDLVLLLPLIFGGGRTSGETMLAFLIIGLGAIPVAFPIGFVLCLGLLPKNLLKAVPKKQRAVGLAISALLVVLPLLFGKSRIDTPEAFVELVRNSPQSLNNKKVGEFFLKVDDLILEDATFEGVEFLESKIHNLIIRNVTFKNCLFKESTFEELALENVTFENCVFARFPSQYSSRYADFETIACKNVVFSGGSLEYLHFNVRGGGNVLVKDVKFRAPKKDHPRLFGGGALDLSVDNSTFDGEMTLAWMDGDNRATLHVTNSRFTVPDSLLLRCSDMKTVWLENCYFDTGSIPSGETTVIRNCHLATSVRQNFRDVTQQKRPDSEWLKHTIYVEDCEFPVRSTYPGWEHGTLFNNQHPETDIYIMGKAPRQKGVNLGLSGGGRMHVFDAEIQCLNITGGSKAIPVEKRRHQRRSVERRVLPRRLRENGPGGGQMGRSEHLPASECGRSRHPGADRPPARLPQGRALGQRRRKHLFQYEDERKAARYSPPSRPHAG